MKILIAEDDKTTRTKLQALLCTDGLELLVAEDGAAALELVKEHGETIDLLLTDFLMPRMDGLELLQEVRKTHPILPVIILTAKNDKEIIRKALKLGADDFLDKPINRDELNKAIESVTEANIQQELKSSLATSKAVRESHNMIMMSTGCEQCAPPDQLSFHYMPLTDAGGDFLHAHTLQDGTIQVILVDVAGHDVSSSYVVAELKGFFSAVRSQISSEPEEFLQMLNNKLQDFGLSNTHVCALVVNWNRETGRVQVANAGIPYGYYQNAEGRMLPVEIDGMMLGVFNDAIFDCISFTLHPEERLLFFTDGIEEHHDPETIKTTWLKLKEMPLKASLENFFATLDICRESVKDDVLTIALQQPPLQVSGEKNITLELTINSNVCLTQRSAVKLENFLKNYTRADSAKQMEILYCLRELVNNAIIHGNEANFPELVVIKAVVNADKDLFTLEIHDQGTGFDMQEKLAEEAAADILRNGGRGLIGINAFSETLEKIEHGVRVVFSI